MPHRFERTVSELESNAVMWWPRYLSSIEENASIIPILVKSQNDFISILNLCNKGPFQVFDLMEASDFPANLFLKHLVVLSDFGGEQIQRVNREFESLFPATDKGERSFEFNWNQKKHKYTFKKLPIRGVLNNNKLGIDGKSLQKKVDLNDLNRDLISMLLFGSTCLDENIAEKLSKCEVGSLMGQRKSMEEYIKQKYIWVSRITGGALANSLGQIAQTYVADYLRKGLGTNYVVKRNGSIKFAEKEKPIPFDVVASRKGKHVGIEVTFQVTTNSVIERKAGQAKARISLINKSGNYVAYVIDGAGNFQRSSAISQICENSDCTVAYSDKEFDILIEFIRGVLG